MEAFTKILESMKLLLTWWFFVEPWERAVHLRLGSRVKLCGPGVHFRIPFLDTVYMHNIRERSISPRCQTLSSCDGVVYTVSLSIAFSVVDVLKLHTSAHDPEPVLQQFVSAAVAEFFATNLAKDILPSKAQEAACVDLSRFGVGNVVVSITGFATTTTFRLVSDPMSAWSHTTLQTTVKHE